MDTRTLRPGFRSTLGSGGSTPSFLRPISTNAPSGVTETIVPSTVSPRLRWDCSNSERISAKELSCADVSGISGKSGSGMRDQCRIFYCAIVRRPYPRYHVAEECDVLNFYP